MADLAYGPHLRYHCSHCPLVLRPPFDQTQRRQALGQTVFRLPHHFLFPHQLIVSFVMSECTVENLALTETCRQWYLVSFMPKPKSVIDPEVAKLDKYFRKVCDCTFCGSSPLANDLKLSVLWLDPGFILLERGRRYRLVRSYLDQPLQSHTKGNKNVSSSESSLLRGFHSLIPTSLVTM